MENVNKNTDVTKREQWIDFLKGIAILCVVVGHSDFSMAKYFIYMFHMPIFFIFSGYLFNDVLDFKHFCLRKAKNLIYPYVVFGILIILWNTFLSCLTGTFCITTLVKRIIAFVYGNYIWENNSQYIGVLWFVLALFCSEILFYIVCKKNRYLWIALYFVLGCFFSVLNMFYRIRLPWCLDVAFVAVIFFGFGNLVREKKLLLKYKNPLLGLFIFIVGGIVGVANMFVLKKMGVESFRVDMLSMIYGCLPLFIASAIMISFGMFVVVKRFYRGGVVFLEHVGRISLLIMINHLYINQIVNIFILNRVINLCVTVIVAVFVALFVERYFYFLYKLKIS